jgi:porin
MNKLFAFVFLLMLSSLTSLAQSDESAWFELETSVTGDFINNLMGGVNRGFTYLGMEELALTFDLEKLGLWSGAEVFLHGLNTHGQSPSQDYVGDLQVSSNIESGDYVGLYEYYLKQQSGNFEFILGQHDLNSEFAGTEYGGTFINSSFGITPTMSLNVPVSIYPIASLAFITKYSFSHNQLLKIGIYDGDPGDPESNRYNLQPNIGLDEGFLFISEYERFLYKNSLPERYKIGAYYHTNRFTNYKDTLTSMTGNYGIYAVSDFVLWSGFNHPYTYLGLFVQGGYAPEHINQADYYLGAGIHLNGILPLRYQDAFGLAFAYVNMSQPYRRLNNAILSGEMALEMTYKISVFDHYTIQPNLQYIIQPGANPDLNNALVASLRFNIFLCSEDHL